ncbi:MAG: recombination regulator RecX [Magnetococcus sp. MYC-9]
MGTPNTIEEIDKQAYDQAIRWLARRGYGRWELQQRLLQSGVSAGQVAQVCDRCQALGYLDDAAFAASRARYRLHHGHHGPRRVWAELRALQVADEDIQQALAPLLEETDECSLAAAALAKRFGPPAQEETERCGRRGHQESKRRYDFLSRRGFNDEAIWQVLNRTQ